MPMLTVDVDDETMDMLCRISEHSGLSVSQVASVLLLVRMEDESRRRCGDYDPHKEY